MALQCLGRDKVRQDIELVTIDRAVSSAKRERRFANPEVVGAIPIRSAKRHERRSPDSLEARTLADAHGRKRRFESFSGLTL